MLFRDYCVCFRVFCHSVVLMKPYTYYQVNIVYFLNLRVSAVRHRRVRKVAKKLFNIASQAAPWF